MADTSALRGTHAVVTGATTPLARVVAVALAEAGATVSVTTFAAVLAEEVQANSILNETWSAGSQGQAKTVDLASAASVEDAFEALEREVAPIDLLANVLANVLAVPADADATGMASACEAAAARMLRRGRGRIVNVVPAEASPAGRAAVVALSQRLAAEAGGRGVEVYTIAVDGAAPLELRAALVAVAVGTAGVDMGATVEARA